VVCCVPRAAGPNRTKDRRDYPARRNLLFGAQTKNLSITKSTANPPRTIAPVSSMCPPQSVGLSQPAAVSHPHPSNDPAQGWSCARGCTWRLNPLTVEGPSTRTRRPSITLTMTQSFPTFLPKLQRQTRPVSTRRLSVVDCGKEREGVSGTVSLRKHAVLARLALHSSPRQTTPSFPGEFTTGHAFPALQKHLVCSTAVSSSVASSTTITVSLSSSIILRKTLHTAHPPRLHAMVLQCHLLMPIPGLSAPLMHQSPASTRKQSDSSLGRYVTNLPKPTTLDHCGRRRYHF
jgi:hypothetical protein